MLGLEEAEEGGFALKFAKPDRFQRKVLAPAKERHLSAVDGSATRMSAVGGECRELTGTFGLLFPSKAGFACPQHYVCTSSSKTAEKEQTEDESWQDTCHPSVLAQYSSRCQCLVGSSELSLQCR